jgi:REP element-mobilizing transposase RayT
MCLGRQKNGVQAMVHGYHVIWGTYGFWLPNDPRGSWSDFIYNWELLRFGDAKKHTENHKLDVEKLNLWKFLARTSLKYPAVSLTGRQALEVVRGFSEFVHCNRLTMWALAILPEHLHMVLGRHRYKIEYACNLLKGAATRQLIQAGLHPFSEYRDENGRLPCMWNSKQWIKYLDSEEAVYNAIRYVEENPVKEGKKKQNWSCVTPFEGLSKGGWYTYY